MVDHQNYQPGQIIWPTQRRKISVIYYEELGPRMIIQTNGRGVNDVMAEMPIVREGNRAFLLHQI